MELIVRADSNRYGCSNCNRSIHQGEKLLRFVHRAWRSSATLNLCEDCIKKMAKEIK